MVRDDERKRVWTIPVSSEEKEYDRCGHCLSLARNYGHTTEEVVNKLLVT